MKVTDCPLCGGDMHLEDFFENERLVITRDQSGWEGYEKRDGLYFSVNVHENGEYLHKKIVTKDEIVERLKNEVEFYNGIDFPYRPP